MGVIKDLRKGSAPEPDGLSNPYYKTFATTLIPHLTKFLNAKMQGDPMDTQLNTVYAKTGYKIRKRLATVVRYPLLIVI